MQGFVSQGRLGSMHDLGLEDHDFELAPFKGTLSTSFISSVAILGLYYKGFYLLLGSFNFIILYLFAEPGANSTEEAIGQVRKKRPMSRTDVTK